MSNIKDELKDELRKVLDNDLKDIPDIPEEMVPTILALMTKISKCKKETEYKNELVNFYKCAMEEMPNPIFLKDSKLRFVFFNKAYREFFGLKENENIGKTVLDLDYLPVFERQRYQDEDAKILNDQASYEYEMVFHSQERQAIDTRYWAKGFECEKCKVKGVVGEIVDISKEKKAVRDLNRSVAALEAILSDTKHEAETDPATGLYNKRVFTQKIPVAINEAKHTGKPLCCMIIDVDKFKYINDTYGHLYGDEVLLSLSKIFGESFRKSDLVARYGGDEFFALLPGAKINQAVECAERMRRKVRDNVVMPKGEPVTLSIGVAQLNDDDDVTKFIARADEALYCSKTIGRDKVTADRCTIG